MSSCCSCKKQEPCCPKFNPEPWQEKEITWDNKLFVKDHVTCVMHMPLNMGCKIMKNMKKIAAAKAIPSEWLMLAEHTSSWGMNIYIAVNKEVPASNMTTISGTFMTKVFEGSYSNMPKWIKEMEEYVKSKGKTLSKMYYYFTTCPKCAKTYGKNHVVLFAKI